MTEVITSSSNKIVKYVKSLHRKKVRWENKSFFVEGVRGIEESILSDGDIEYILYSQSLFDVKGGNEIFELIKKKGYTSYQITDTLLKELSDTQNPQGAIAVLRFKVHSLEDLLKTEKKFFLLLDRVQDPGNMGTIIRTADAFGVDGIVITNGSVDILNPKVVRSTMGSIFHIPFCFVDDAVETVESLKDKGVKVGATSLESNYLCHEVNYNDDIAIIIGNEASGVAEELLTISDYRIKIPMSGKAESLNVAIATSILIYEAFKQRQNF